MNFKTVLTLVKMVVIKLTEKKFKACTFYFEILFKIQVFINILQSYS